ncbi:hypothetical protein C8Q76DRAFT_799586 [Earliella scabrosa]|nr:hypothetical protein C8Q76DRAFT_799586 [Earliella scabrosa]
MSTPNCHRCPPVRSISPRSPLNDIEISPGLPATSSKPVAAVGPVPYSTLQQPSIPARGWTSPSSTHLMSTMSTPSPESQPLNPQVPRSCVQCAQAGCAQECSTNRRTIGCRRCNAHRLGCSYLGGRVASRADFELPALFHNLNSALHFVMEQNRLMADALHRIGLRTTRIESHVAVLASSPEVRNAASDHLGGTWCVSHGHLRHREGLREGLDGDTPFPGRKRRRLDGSAAETLQCQDQQVGTSRRAPAPPCEDRNVTNEDLRCRSPDTRRVSATSLGGWAAREGAGEGRGPGEEHGRTP